MPAEIENILNQYPDANREDVLPILQNIQDQYGYIPEEAIIGMGKHFNLPTSKIYGLATFYNLFSFTPRGKFHIEVCTGTSCHLEGAANIVKAFEKQLEIQAGGTTRDKLFSLDTVPCLGGCQKAPVIAVNGTYYQPVDEKKIKEIITHCREMAEEKNDT